MNQAQLDKIKNDYLKTNPVFKTPVNVHPLEQRLVLRNCQVIDPESIVEYIAKDG